MRRILYFGGDRTVDVRREACPEPSAGEAYVEVAYSAVSAGTERLAYTGSIPRDQLADATIGSLDATGYPMPYGYACAGTVREIGPDVDPSWVGCRVFAFHPHASAAVVSAASLVPVPEGMSLQAATLFPNVETAVNLVMDGRPMIGERVVVFGLGVVGLLTVAVLLRHPVAEVIGVDPDARRRSVAERAGATALPSASAVREHLGTTGTDAPPAGSGPDDEAGSDGLHYDGAHYEGAHYEGADLVYECTGRPGVLEQAVSACGFSGRVVVGSWYGTKRAEIGLGGRFHRSRIQVVSSQVSTIAPELRGRWTKARRGDVAMNAVRDVQAFIDTLVTRVAPLEEAEAVYDSIASDSSNDVQVLFDYRIDAQH
jgi:threonine dehydrogenase-like Zn-dependent dehydrogenase